MLIRKQSWTQRLVRSQWGGLLPHSCSPRGVSSLWAWQLANPGRGNINPADLIKLPDSIPFPHVSPQPDSTRTGCCLITGHPTEHCTDSGASARPRFTPITQVCWLPPSRSHLWPLRLSLLHLCAGGWPRALYSSPLEAPWPGLVGVTHSPTAPNWGLRNQARIETTFAKRQETLLNYLFFLVEKLRNQSSWIRKERKKQRKLGPEREERGAAVPGRAGARRLGAEGLSVPSSSFSPAGTSSSLLLWVPKRMLGSFKAYGFPKACGSPKRGCRNWGRW